MKKEKRKNMEFYKSIFFQIGLLFALALVLFAFEWKTYAKSNDKSTYDNYVIIDEEMAPITTHKQKVQIVEPVQLKIVNDDVEVKTDININVESNENDTLLKYVNIGNDDPDPIFIEPTIFTVVEIMPTFPGGEEKLMEYLSKNIKYPEIAKQTGIEGIVFISFVVESNGEITNINKLRGIGGGCDEESIRVIKNMPTWEPGIQQGRPVRVQVNLPISFELK
jgi:protein TonB